MNRMINDADNKTLHVCTLSRKTKAVMS